MLEILAASKCNPWYRSNASEVNNFLLSFGIPTQRICRLLSLHVVTSFGNIAPCPWSRSFSCSPPGRSPAPARPRHTNSRLPCSDWMRYFHVVLETAFPRLFSMSAPAEQHFPHCPHWFRHSALPPFFLRLCCATHLRTNWLLYVFLCSPEQSVLVLFSPLPPLVSTVSLLHLSPRGPLPSSLP